MFTLPKLDYKLDQLEPHLSKTQLDLHYNKHHQSYIDKLNKLHFAGYDDNNLIGLVKYLGPPGISRDRSQNDAFNNAAQHFNHSFYWKSLKVPGSYNPASITFSYIIDKTFGDFNTMVGQFIRMGMSQFGSGWIWLVALQDVPRIIRTDDAHTPLEFNCKPLLVCDVWEHAYYIDYQQDKEKYLTNFITQLANWKFASENFEH